VPDLPFVYTSVTDRQSVCKPLETYQYLLELELGWKVKEIQFWNTKDDKTAIIMLTAGDSKMNGKVKTWSMNCYTLIQRTKRTLVHYVKWKKSCVTGYGTC
jgi:hypothetical protein